MILSPDSIDNAVRRALDEDIPFFDVTSDHLIPDEQVSEAKIVAKAAGVLCGMPVVLRTFELLDPNVKITVYKKDGEAVTPGDDLCFITGRTTQLLKAERTALNFLQHLSGVATATNLAVQAISGTGAVLCDTRKTLPGLRAMQKYAVMVGGGKNHRFSLSDSAMLKDNHIDACGGITAAVLKLRERLGHTVKIEVETRTLEEVCEAMSVHADIIMLDNMDLETMQKAAEIVNKKAILEASGGVTHDTIRAVALTGVDIVSLGALTHSVKALDISMKIG